MAPDSKENKLLQLYVARTPGPIQGFDPLRAESVIKLVSVLFGKMYYPRGYEMLTNGNRTNVL